MAKVITVPASNLGEAMRQVVSARQAVTEGIATHAEKHRAKLEADRHAAEDRARIEEGIKRSGGNIHTS